MSTGRADPPLPGCLRDFPGAVVQVDADGVVVDSNGRLDSALDRALVGRPFAEALDAESSGAKWERLRRRAAEAPGGVSAELVLAGRETLPEPRAFSVLRDADAGMLWLVEHPADARLDRLREEVTEVNSELANTQRDLLKERSRLAHLLAELEEQYRTQERLSAMLSERNEALEAASRELERSNRALDEFAHVVSHDLKAPLRSIGNYSAWIEEDHGAELAEEARAQLRALRGQVTRMRRMIDGVLAYARAGREGSSATEVDVGALLDEVVAIVAPPAGVTMRVERPMPTLVTESVPLGQVLQNLVDNAVKHARRADPEVVVRARLEGGWCEFTVADNGPGIPPRLRDRIWELFRTGEPTDGVDRTGIGLAVVRREVEARGGRVWVDSGPEGGAIFRFTWPAHPMERD